MPSGARDGFGKGKIVELSDSWATVDRGTRRDRSIFGKMARARAMQGFFCVAKATQRSRYADPVTCQDPRSVSCNHLEKRA